MKFIATISVIRKNGSCNTWALEVKASSIKGAKKIASIEYLRSVKGDETFAVVELMDTDFCILSVSNPNKKFDNAPVRWVDLFDLTDYKQD